MNLRAVDETLAHLYEVEVPQLQLRPAHPVPTESSSALRSLCAMCWARSWRGRGDRVPVSVLPNDGTYPTGTTQWEKRNLASEVPVWDPASLYPMRQMRDGLSACRHS